MSGLADESRSLFDAVQRDLDLTREQVARDRGMAVAAANNDASVTLLRLLATQLAAKSPEGTVSMNEIREELQRRGIKLREGNWMGSVFKGGRWRRVGFTKARHKGSHARLIGVWRPR